MRNISKVARDYWDYTTLDPKILAEAARLTAEDLPKLARYVEKAYQELRATARLRVARERAARGRSPGKASSHVRQRK